MSAIMDEFANWLFSEMQKRRINQSELARRAGISRQAVSDYVNSRRSKPDIEALAGIAGALDYPVEYVLEKAGLITDKKSKKQVAEQIASFKLEELTTSQLDEVIQFIEFIQSRDERNLDRRTSYKISREGEAPPEVIKE